MGRSVSAVAYRPVSVLLSVAAGVAAGAVFRQVWRLAAGDGEAPEATDEHRTWGEILAAAALQGAIFAVVRAAVDRAGAVGVRRLTGRWPD
jgi:predicted metal-dependent enzyme (double-stranded beta helix superfamily)